MGKRSRDSSSESDGSEDRKHSKKERKEKHKHKHKHKKEKKEKRHRSEEEERERELVKEAKRFLKKKLKEGKGEEALAAAELLGRHKGLEEQPTYEGDIEPISRDDYFKRNPEFSAWLREARGKFFTELDGEATHVLFAEFVDAWNSGKLPARFYEGQAGGSGRTAHTWAIKGGAGGAGSGAVGMAAALDEELHMKEAAKEAAAAQRREARARDKASAEEWLGAKPQGGTREARQEAKAARREAARAREESPDLVRLPGGGDPYGDDSFAAAKAREARRGETRGRRVDAKRAELEQKLAAKREAEDEKMAQFRALLAGAGGALSIPKRQD